MQNLHTCILLMNGFANSLSKFKFTKNNWLYFIYKALCLVKTISYLSYLLFMKYVWDIKYNNS